MVVKLTRIEIQNFKGIKNLTVYFKDSTTVIRGKNAAGKTSVFDAFTWCLFGKNSDGKEKFEIRTLDADGNKIHNTEISVIVTLFVDGKEIVFRKVQTENWVKKRGSETATLQGNNNSYEVNGYPSNEADYKEKIAEIISEDRFKLLSNPAYFPSLDWKEQRKIIMEFANEKSDADLAREIGGFDAIIDELENAPDFDAIKDKYTKRNKAWKDEQKELPIRIDELENQKVDYPVSDLELELNALTEKLESLNAESGNEKASEIRKQIDEITDKAAERKREVLERSDKDRAEISDLKARATEIQTEVRCLSSELDSEKTALVGKKALVDSLKPKYAELKALAFDEKTTICPTCKREYPAERVSELKANFESDKQKRIKEMADEGNSAACEVKKITERIAVLEKDLHDKEVSLGDLTRQIEQKNGSYNPDRDLNEDSVYNGYIGQIDALKRELETIKADAVKRETEIRTEKSETQSAINAVNEKIAKAKANVTIDERIEELKARQLEVAQLVADNEKILYLLEQFTEAKMDKISETINSNFDGVDFNLFSVQINGGIKETCECSVNGVPYNTLNSGHRIVAGLTIIKALQRLYDCNSLVFIDNAETINEVNIPAMDNQLILLKVTDDERLVCE